MAHRTLLLTVLLGCGGAAAPVAPTPVVVTGPSLETESPPALCEYRGTWAMRLRARARFEYGDIRDAEGTGRLERGDAGLVLRAELRKNGWRLQSESDPAVDAVFKLRAETHLNRTLALSAGTVVLVDDVSDGRVRVRAPNPVLEQAGIRLLVAADAGLTCDGITLGSVRATRVGSDGSPVRLRANSVVPVFAEPRGEAALELVVGEHSMAAQQYEERDGFVRITRRHGGAVVTGWIALAHLDDSARVSGRGMLGSLRGGIGGGGSINVCRTEHELALRAESGEDSEQVGGLDANARFVLLEDEGESLRLRPHPEDGIQLMPGATFVTDDPGGLQCTEEERPGLAGILGALTGQGVGGLGGVAAAPPPPTHNARLRVRVRRARGLAGVSRGTECTVVLTHSRSCRAEITCGAHTVFGFSPRNGFFNCQFSDNPLRIVGEDVSTSDQDGADPAMRLDTDAGTLTMSDTRAGHVGEFELEGQIRSSQIVP